LLKRYSDVRRKFKNGWKWDLVNSAKFKLIEYLRWRDVPEEFKDSIVKAFTEANKGYTAKEAWIEVEKQWDEGFESEYPLQEPPIVTDIKTECEIIEKLYPLDQNAARVRLPRVYALFWLLGEVPKNVGRSIKSLNVEETLVEVGVYLSRFKRIGKESNSSE